MYIKRTKNECTERRASDQKQCCLAIFSPLFLLPFDSNGDKIAEKGWMRMNRPTPNDSQLARWNSYSFEASNNDYCFLLTRARRSNFETAQVSLVFFEKYYDTDYTTFFSFVVIITKAEQVTHQRRTGK